MKTVVLKTIGDLRRLTGQSNSKITEEGETRHFTTEELKEVLQSKEFKEIFGTVEILELSSEELEELPDDILNELPELKEIKINCEKLRKASDKLFSESKKLKKVEIKHTQLSTMPSIEDKELESLTLENNKNLIPSPTIVLDAKEINIAGKPELQNYINELQREWILKTTTDLELIEKQVFNSTTIEIDESGYFKPDKKELEEFSKALERASKILLRNEIKNTKKTQNLWDQHFKHNVKRKLLEDPFKEIKSNKVMSFIKTGFSSSAFETSARKKEMFAALKWAFERKDYQDPNLKYFIDCIAASLGNCWMPVVDMHLRIYMMYLALKKNQTEEERQSLRVCILEEKLLEEWIKGANALPRFLYVTDQQLLKDFSRRELYAVLLSLVKKTKYEQAQCWYLDSDSLADRAIELAVREILKMVLPLLCKTDSKRNFLDKDGKKISEAKLKHYEDMVIDEEKEAQLTQEYIEGSYLGTTEESRMRSKILGKSKEAFQEEIDKTEKVLFYTDDMLDFPKEYQPDSKYTSLFEPNKMMSEVLYKYKDQFQISGEETPEQEEEIIKKMKELGITEWNTLLKSWLSDKDDKEVEQIKQLRLQASHEVSDEDKTPIQKMLLEIQEEKRELEEAKKELEKKERELEKAKTTIKQKEIEQEKASSIKKTGKTKNKKEQEYNKKREENKLIKEQTQKELQKRKERDELIAIERSMKIKKEKTLKATERMLRTMEMEKRKEQRKKEQKDKFKESYKNEDAALQNKKTSSILSPYNSKVKVEKIDYKKLKLRRAEPRSEFFYTKATQSIKAEPNKTKEKPSIKLPKIQNTRLTLQSNEPKARMPMPNKAVQTQQSLSTKKETTTKEISSYKKRQEYDRTMTKNLQTTQRGRVY